MPDFLTPRSNSRLMTWWWSLDRIGFLCLLALAAFGVVMVATASPSVATRIGLGGFHFLKNHMVFLVAALGVMVSLTWLKPRQVWRFASLLFIGAFLGVVITLISGAEVKGATRWIYVFGFSVQPSEFLKPAFVVLSAFFLSKQKQDESFPGVSIALGLYAVMVAVLIMQPDFGMTFLISLVFAAQIFLAGCPLRFIAGIASIGLVGVVLAYFSLSHVQSRIDRFLFPDSGDSYQIDRSMEAFMNGGVIGTGPGQGTVKLQIPDVHSDFIFSAVGEEWGFVFTVLLVGVFAFVYYRMLARLGRAESLFVLLGGSGLVVMLAMQTFIHMGSALRLLPAKGMTLPLISYGGSSLIAVGISFGLILALSRGIINHRKAGGWRNLTRKDMT